MNKKILIILGILILGGVWYFFSNRAVPIKNNPSSGTDIIAFGDSLIEGVGATEGMSLPDQLGQRLGVPVYNYGVAGDTTAGGLRRIDSALSQHNPKIVILSLGGNDFLKKVPREDTKKNLATLLQKIQSKGAIVVLLGVRSGIIGGGFDDEFESLSRTYGTLYVEDILSDIFGDTRYMSDAVHPNDAGYAKIADRIVEALKTLDQK